MRSLSILLAILAAFVFIGCDRPDPSGAASAYDADLDGQAVQIYTVEPNYDLVLTAERKRALRQRDAAAGVGSPGSAPAGATTSPDAGTDSLGGQDDGPPGF